MTVRLVFLGTGAAGGTPGTGRSARHESSLLVRDAATSILIDATRHFAQQAHLLDRVDALLLTHAHRDASGGIPALRPWLHGRGIDQLRVLAHPDTIAAIEARYRQLDHCNFVPTPARSRRRIGAWTAEALEVPHASESHFPTYVWRLRGKTPRSTATVIYASDVATLTPELERFSRGAGTLVVDGATWRRRIFSHLRIDEDLPRLCAWDVGQILLTQIGRSAPPNGTLTRLVAGLCPRARPAYDGLVVRV